MHKILPALALMLFATAAWAGTCPVLMSDIDEALQNETRVAQLSDDELERVRELRQQGEEYHQAGDHAQSEDALNEARNMLGL